MISAKWLHDWFEEHEEAFVQDRSAGGNFSYVTIDGKFDLDELARAIAAELSTE